MGSRIYIDNNVLTRQRYAATLKAFYDTDVINANLSDTHAIATEVNSWISNITNGNIEKVIDDGVFEAIYIYLRLSNVLSRNLEKRTKRSYLSN